MSSTTTPTELKPPQLGLIEGFYGPLWPQQARDSVAQHVAGAGYGFYHYAPKADPAVRENWREPRDDAAAAELAAFGERCHGLGLGFGVGLTPLGIDLPPSRADYRHLGRRLDELETLGASELLIGFDDTYGGPPDLARRQAELVHWIAGRARVERVCVCPTYYSDDPLLDKLFGQRPPRYLEELGRALEPGIDVYWAGPAICPAVIPPAHIEAVAEALDRPPLLWDNYPVNDGPAMAPHLHLRAPTGRSSELAALLAGHAVNPALQPTLSMIPALALAECYRSGNGYDPATAFDRAATAVLGETLAQRVAADLPELQDAGREALLDPAGLRARYADSAHPGAREIVAWLDGAYQPSDVPTQP
jgi:hypothetical protein